jgi:hypothetical protein
VVVDVDDTILDTTRRMHAIWRELLGREVPAEAVETMGLRQIFEAYATPQQKENAGEHQARFLRLLLCEEERGFEFAQLDEAIPYAADTVNAWAKHGHIVYLTGRTENTRSHTLEALRRHGFPLDDAEMFMVSAEDWHSGRAVDARRALLSDLVSRYEVMRVVDDHPGYFPMYVEAVIPDRVGLLRPMHTQAAYMEKGATRVVDGWQRLLDEVTSSS